MQVLNKKFLVRLLIAVVLFFVFVFVTDQFLTKSFEISRQIKINAPKQTIHDYVANLENWSKWTPWQSDDPTIKTTLGEITKGKGATMSWSGSAGVGSLLATESSAENGFFYTLNFEGDNGTYECEISYKVENGLVNVFWIMRGQSDEEALLPGFRTLLVDAMMGEMFTNGLKNLKSVVESN